jgi:hypothetical protein
MVVTVLRELRPKNRHSQSIHQVSPRSGKTLPEFENVRASLKHMWGGQLEFVGAVTRSCREHYTHKFCDLVQLTPWPAVAYSCRSIAAAIADRPAL